MKLLLLVLCAVCAFAKLASDVPLFVWSGEGSYFSGKNVGLSSGLQETDIGSLFESVLSGNTAPAFNTVLKSMKPEALIIFLEPQVRLDQVSSHSSQLSALKSLMQSASSFYAPFVDFTDDLDSEVISAARLASEKGASVYYAGKGDSLLPDLKLSSPAVNVVSLKNLQNVLETSKIFANGVTDLIIVHLDNVENLQARFENTNQVIASVMKTVSEHTSKYVAVYTGLSFEQRAQGPLRFDSEITQKRSSLDMMMSSEFQFVSQTDNTTNGTQPNWFQVYFPGWFWEVALMFVLVFPWILIGFFQLMAVQVPDTFVIKAKKS